MIDVVDGGRWNIIYQPFRVELIDVLQCNTRKIVIDIYFVQSRHHQKDICLDFTKYISIKTFVVLNCETSTKFTPKSSLLFVSLISQIFWITLITEIQIYRNYRTNIGTLAIEVVIHNKFLEQRNENHPRPPSTIRVIVLIYTRIIDRNTSYRSNVSYK